MGAADVNTHGPVTRGAERPWPVADWVPGTLLVAFLVATGRWGSYISVPGQQIYVSDVLLAVTCLTVAVMGRHRIHRVVRTSSAVLLPAVALLAWAIVRFAAGGRADVDALRDVAPYAYVVTALVVAFTRGQQSLRASYRVLYVALLLHLVLVTVSLRAPDLVQQAPLLRGQVRVMELRPDFDASMVAVLAGLAMHSLLARRGHPLWLRLIHLGLLPWCVLVVGDLATRAGLLALAAALLLAALASLRGGPVLSRRKLVAAGLVAAAGLAFVAPQTSVYGRIAGDKSFADNDAGGTTNARRLAWEMVLDHQDDSASRVLLGVGFGPNFLATSGAAPLFEGDTYTRVRAPHNYLLNTYARLGAVGLVLLVWLLLAVVVATVNVLRRHAGDPLLVGAALIAGCLFVTSQFGVILETPFGAIVFFWCCGLLLTAGGSWRSRGDGSAVVAATPAVRRLE